ncbi:hypothetical protein ABDJ38_09255 [Aurantiacibacter sp. DGU5]|uniref:Uncharacterized protein n=2 Tax=Aurantiacibacter flavus TaxID=3145232 RepID=A0ABV0CWV5_9SPHN
MTTIAVRASRSSTDNEAIYDEAVKACQALQEQLASAVRSEYPPQQAEELLTMLDDQAKPNFLNMLQRIRADRAARGAQQ